MSAQLELFDALPSETSPWSGYGWIMVQSRSGPRRLFALVYRTWDRWFALPRENPGLKRDLHGTMENIVAFGELVRPLTTREEVES